MSKKLLTRTRKFLRSDATRLSPEAIEEIRNAQNNIPDARCIMCKKHHIGATTYQKIIDNQRPPEPTEEWRRILESVSVSDRISENNQESLQLVSAEHDTPSTNIQEDEVIHTEHSGNDRDSANSHIRLNTVTSERKDKVSRKKNSMKARGESSPVEKNRIVNSFKDDTSRRESDLNKLLNITGNIVTHPIFSL
ncbi:7837_t:CDS:1 [Gigaspora margarita]|uniref:7837_t:CDS:1 n=1 Tax=Gigaspora margarita TaxID=4874 RepID=A0ABN7V8Z9_GIGMA|nr:7837_t:CDS:1 [Gigaspora margarita]